MKRLPNAEDLASLPSPLQKSNSEHQNPLNTSDAANGMFTDLTNMKRRLKAKRRLTVPLVSMAHTPILVCLVEGEPVTMHITTGVGKEKSADPTVVPILNLDTGEDGLLICNTIILSAFSKIEGGVTGKYFSLRSSGIRDGKAYRDIDIVEMEMDEE